MIYFLSFICVLALSIGQIIFKLSAIESKVSGSFFTVKFFYLVSAAFLIYGLATFLWIWILQKIDLGKLYPINALAFVFVPIASHFIFGEIFKIEYWIGVFFIVVGLLFIGLK